MQPQELAGAAPQQRTVENCATFGQFVQRVTKMASNNDAVAFEGIIRNRRDACVFILEQRDTYAPPALSASALAKVWTQLGCAIDVSRVVSPDVARRVAAAKNDRQQHGANGVGSVASSSTVRRAEERRAKTGLLPSAQLVSSLDSVVTSIEWATVTVCGKQLNAGGCYVNALEMDPLANAAAWFNLGCWLSSETKEVVKGNARAMAMVRAEEDEERRTATARSGRASVTSPVNRHGIPRGGTSAPGGRPHVPPLQQQQQNGAASSSSPTAAGAASSSSLIVLPAGIIDRREFTAALCFARAVAVDEQLQGGWLNLGAALALEQLLEKRGALPEGRPPITIESIEAARRDMRSDGNTNIGYLKAGAGAAVAAEDASSSKRRTAKTTGPVTRQFCYVRELEASLRRSAEEAIAASAAAAGTEGASLTASTTDANLIGPSSLSSPYYLARHPGAINSVTFTDSCPSSQEEKAKTKRLRHERRVNRYRSLAITADSRGPSRETVRALAWVNLAATFESLHDTVGIVVRDFYVPMSHLELGGKYISPSEPVRINLGKKQCLEAAIAEDSTVAKAWLNLGAAMDDDEFIVFVSGANREQKQRINRLHCFVKAIEVSNDTNPILWHNIAISLFDDLKASAAGNTPAGRELCMRLPLKSRRRISGNSGNPSVHEQRAAIVEERVARRQARIAAEKAALEAAVKAAAEGVAMPLTKAQLDRLNYLNPNPTLNAKKRRNKGGEAVVPPPPTPGFEHFDDDEDEDDDAPIPVFAQTFDCIDCMEEYLSRCPDDGKAWLQLAHMFQYFKENGASGGNGAPTTADGSSASADPNASAIGIRRPPKNGAAASGASADSKPLMPASVAEAVAIAMAKKQRAARRAAGIVSSSSEEEEHDDEDWEDVEEDEEEEEEENEEIEAPAAAKAEEKAARDASSPSKAGKKGAKDAKKEEAEAEEDEEEWEDVDDDEEDEEEEEAEDLSPEAQKKKAMEAYKDIECALAAVAVRADPSSPPDPLPCELVVAGYRYTSPREVFAEVARCEPSNGEVWYTLGNYLYYDPRNTSGEMTVRIGRSRRGEALTYKECYSKAQSLGAMSRFACCTIM